MNLRELYVTFKEKYPEAKIGFSIFCTLRPKHCVFAGSRGTLNICVCTIHQNPRLMLEDERLYKLTEGCTMPLRTCEDCLRLMVCNMDSPECRLKTCTACPGKAALEESLVTIFKDANVKSVQFKQWTTVDRCEMQNITAPVEDFILLFAEKMWKLLEHSFLAKRQSSFLQLKKQQLNEKEIIVIGDYSENFSCVAQDAPQGWHWTHKQATVHPFVVYYKQEGELQHFRYVVISEHLVHNTAAVNLF